MYGRNNHFVTDEPLNLMIHRCDKMIRVYLSVNEGIAKACRRYGYHDINDALVPRLRGRRMALDCDMKTMDKYRQVHALRNEVVTSHNTIKRLLEEKPVQSMLIRKGIEKVKKSSNFDILINNYTINDNTGGYQVIPDDVMAHILDYVDDSRTLRYVMEMRHDNYLPINKKALVMKYITLYRRQWKIRDDLKNWVHGPPTMETLPSSYPETPFHHNMRVYKEQARQLCNIGGPRSIFQQLKNRDASDDECTHRFVRCIHEACIVIDNMLKLIEHAHGECEDDMRLRGTDVTSLDDIYEYYYYINYYIRGRRYHMDNPLDVYNSNDVSSFALIQRKCRREKYIHLKNFIDNLEDYSDEDSDDE